MKNIFGGKNAKVSLAVLLGLVVLLATGAYWYQTKMQQPEYVFKRMLNNAVQTSSFARHSTQEQAGQNLVVASFQALAPYHQVYAKNVLTQGDGGTVIETENIATTDKNYVRYTDIQTDQKRQTGENFDFNSVLDIWGEAPAANAESSTSQLYSQNLVVPIVNLSPTDRKQLLDQIKNDNVYTVDFSAVNEQTVDGRQTYTYSVTVAPVAYINMLKTLDSMLGVNQLQNLDPTIYENTPPLAFAFDIDVLSGQLVKITYQNNQLEETFDSYGAKPNILTPDETIPLQELQSRLQQLQ